MQKPIRKDGHLRSAYLWNTIGSALNAFQSVIILMVLTRACGLATSGVFTLAYANANLFLTIGFFGMRSFEASDVVPRYGFRAYGLSRVATCLAMVACSWGWLAWSAATNGYSADKVLAVALMTLMKGVDAVEDVFDGSFQQSGRLDVAGKQLTLRVGSTILLFCVVAAATRDLVVATGIGFVWTAGYLLASLVRIRRLHGLPEMHREARLLSPWPLLGECLPLSLVSFLVFYVGSAPKYAIDALMDDGSQAIFGFVFMPVYVVNLLAQFVFMPLVQSLSEMWARGDRGSFVRGFARQAIVIGGITAACVLAAAVAGPPVLGLLYNCDLSPYRLDLCLLVFGGGLLAMVSLLNMGITIMRRQGLLVPGYVIAALVAALATAPSVGSCGILGAAVCYVGSMTVLVACLACLFAWLLRQ